MRQVTKHRPWYSGAMPLDLLPGTKWYISSLSLPPVMAIIPTSGAEAGIAEVGYARGLISQCDGLSHGPGAEKGDSYRKDNFTIIRSPFVSIYVAVFLRHCFVTF